MPTDTRVQALYDRWQKLRSQGLNLTPEEVCQESPELADKLRELMTSSAISFQQPGRKTPDTLAERQRPRNGSEYPFLEPPQNPDELGRLATFRILRVIGQGGMGIVFEGEDAALQRRVAVKVLRPEMESDSLEERFQREAQLAASLNHDHIVTIYQIGHHADRPFLVMEYLVGESLSQRLERDGWLPALEALEIVRQAALGLAVAHERGLIHRDIKPANIWLESERPGGRLKRVKILDFGLARPILNHDTLSTGGDLIGTPNYMAPEQIFGRPLDGRTDLYSLGCTLYACLMGTPPFVKDDTTALLEAIAFENSPDLGKLDGRMPPAVAVLLTQLLAKDPEARPPTAAVVADRLSALETADTLSSPATSQTELLKANSRKLSQRISAHLHGGVWLGGIAISAAILVALVMGFRSYFGAGQDDNPNKSGGDQTEVIPRPTGPDIRIGVLYSLSGTFAGSERPMADGIMLAVEQINNAGGVLGRPIKPVIVDARSRAEGAAQAAEKLLTEDNVLTIFGCASSSSRKLVSEVCRKHDSLLVFASIYEGLEQSPYVVYAGGAPNQQIQPSATYAYSDLHKRKFFLVGSDYVYSHAANEILKDRLTGLGATIVGTEYEPLGGVDFKGIVERIKASKADMVMNTVDGSSNIAFFHAMRRAGLTPDQVPIMWLSVGEEDMASIPSQELEGDYIALPYFQSIESPANRAFLESFRTKYPTRRADDAAEAAYAAVYLWKQAVQKANSVSPDRIREAIGDQRFEAPEGPIRIDKNNLHAWRIARIARIVADRQFEIVFTSPKPLQPEPFPTTRKRGEWESYLKKLNEDWGQRWERPRP
jgi:urea transport system substrate-binding protein